MSFVSHGPSGEPAFSSLLQPLLVPNALATHWNTWAGGFTSIEAPLVWLTARGHSTARIYCQLLSGSELSDSALARQLRAPRWSATQKGRWGERNRSGPGAQPHGNFSAGQIGRKSRQGDPEYRNPHGREPPEAKHVANATISPTNPEQSERRGREWSGGRRESGAARVPTD